MSDATTKTTRRSSKQPLEGVRVLEFGWVVAGTIPGMLLADLGAEVIKVESSSHLDLNRQGPGFNDDSPSVEQKPRFHNLNRGKLGMTLDLRHEDSRDVLARLVASSDVLVENFSPGVLQKLHLGYSELAAWRPDLVMASISAVGQTGPWSDARGYALTIGALSGFAGLIGYDGEAPLGDEFMYPDVVAALHATVAILAALHHRDATGVGQYIDVSMLESMGSVLAEPILCGSVADEIVMPRGHHDPSFSPHGIFRAAGDDEWLAIAATSTTWPALCEVIGADDLAADVELLSRDGRVAADARIRDRIEQWTRARSKHDAAEVLRGRGVAAAPVLDLQEHLDDPVVAALGIYENVEHPAMGVEEILATPWDSRPEFARIAGRAPLLGEHNEYVVCELLGLPYDSYSTLRKQGVLS